MSHSDYEPELGGQWIGEPWRFAMLPFPTVLRVCLVATTIALAGPVGPAAGQMATPASYSEADVAAARKTFEPAGLRVNSIFKDQLTIHADRNVTDEVLKRLPPTDIRFTLTLFESQVTANGLKELVKYSNMDGLALFGCEKITDDAIEVLAKLPALRDLDLRSTGVTPKGLRALTGVKRLAELGIGGKNTDDDALKAVASLSGLVRLSIHSADQLTGKGLEALAGLEHLEELELARCPKVDAGLESIAGLKRLRSLFVISMPVSEKGMKAIGGLRDLNALAVTGAGVTDAGAHELRGLGRLTYLHLPENPDLTDVGLAHLHVLTGLTELNVKKTKVTPAGVAALRKAVPKVEVER